MASQITGISIVGSTICSSADQRKHQSSTSLAFVTGIHQLLVESSHKGPVTHFYLMMSSCARFLGMGTIRNGEVTGEDHRKVNTGLNNSWTFSNSSPSNPLPKQVLIISRVWPFCLTLILSFISIFWSLGNNTLPLLKFILLVWYVIAACCTIRVQLTNV